MRIKRHLVLAMLAASISVTGCAPSIVEKAVDIAKDTVQDKVTGKAGNLLEGITEKLGKDEKKENVPKESLTESKEDASAESSTEAANEEELIVNEDPYDVFLREELEKKLGEERNLSFQYGYERQDSGGAYWFAAAEPAPLADSLISISRNDLNQDGQDELLVCHMEGSQGTGSGHNCLRMDAYTMSDQEVTKIGSIQFPNCFEVYNGEEYVIGLKTVGQNTWIYTYNDGDVWTWADGVNPQIRLYQYDGSYLKEQYNVSCSGSDGSWWDGWTSDLRSFGFDVPNNLWENPQLIGESNFEIILYGESTTIVDKDEMYKDMNAINNAQQYMLEHAVAQGSLSGKESKVVSLMNANMNAVFDSSRNTGNMPSYDMTQNDYVIPDSSSRYLTRSDLLGLSPEQLRIARNEIYARHGRRFQSEDLQTYFDSKSWYRGTIEPSKFSEDNLNAYEKENVKLIKSMEE